MATIHTLVLLGNANIFPELLWEFTRRQTLLLVWMLADPWTVSCMQLLFSGVYSLCPSSVLNLTMVLLTASVCFWGIQHNLILKRNILDKKYRNTIGNLRAEVKVLSEFLILCQLLGYFLDLWILLVSISLSLVIQLPDIFLSMQRLWHL